LIPVLKNSIKYILQSVFGYDRYLYIFSIFKINTLKWDSAEGDFFHFLTVINKEGVLLDIGANIGIMTYYLARLRKGKVHCFEPMPSNLSVLNKIIARYNLTNTVVHPIALGESDSEVEIILPIVGNVKMQGLSHVKHKSIEDFNDGESFSVPCKTLDNINFNGQPIVGIKIDVENFEYFVLKGGQELLKQHKPPIYIELWMNQNRDDCFELLKNLKYEIMVVVNGEITEYDSIIHTNQNFIAF